MQELPAGGCLTAKAGPQPVCVFWHDDRAYALDDRCPHLGFPLHRGTLEDGLVTWPVRLASSPPRRELAQVVRTATRLRRGESLYEDSD